MPGDVRSVQEVGVRHPRSLAVVAVQLGFMGAGMLAEACSR